MTLDKLNSGLLSTEEFLIFIGSYSQIMTAMKLLRTYTIILLLLSANYLHAQVESVPSQHEVYHFLKVMKVKGLIDRIHDDDPLMMRGEVRRFLEKLDTMRADLSSVEVTTLNKYLSEFRDDMISEDNTHKIFGGDMSLGDRIVSAFREKKKYLYHYRDENANLFIRWFGDAYWGQRFRNDITNSIVYGTGFAFQGTVLDNLGYNFTFEKGLAGGSKSFAEIMDPRLPANFKWVEDMENIGNYDYTRGYLRYLYQPVEDMSFVFQIGRENISYGYGYGSKFVLNDRTPLLDFFKFDFDYGIVHFTSLHAQGVSYFNIDRSKNVNKYFAINKVRLSFPGWFDIGIGENIIYSGRGIDLAYFNPMIFYKFVEMSLQDRDNGTMFFDIQSDAIDNLELQATFFMDESIINDMQWMDRYSNKTGYQLGAFWYEPFGLENASLIGEYTKIRPFTYSHYNIHNNYTSWGIPLGHRIGSNADEIAATFRYTASADLRFEAGYRFVRRGENVYDANGNLIYNVGGDILLTHRDNIDPMTAPFLAGNRYDQHIVTLFARYEFLRDLAFTFYYHFEQDQELATGNKSILSYLGVKFIIDF